MIHWKEPGERKKRERDSEKELERLRTQTGEGLLPDAGSQRDEREPARRQLWDWPQAGKDTPFLSVWGEGGDREGQCHCLCCGRPK